MREILLQNTDSKICSGEERLTLRSLLREVTQDQGYQILQKVGHEKHFNQQYSHESPGGKRQRAQKANDENAEAKSIECTQ